MNDVVDPMPLTTHIQHYTFIYLYKFIGICMDRRGRDEAWMGPPSPASQLPALSEAALSCASKRHAGQRCRLNPLLIVAKEDPTGASRVPLVG